MTKLYRRTWEKWAYGRAGAISSPLSARSGTDGAISGASTSTPVAILTSATANFVSTDVGRLIRLTGTPSNRFDGLFIIDAVNSSTSVSLRYNHNTGCPTSAARFMQTGTGITWRIQESCTFTADASGDLAAFMAGSYIAIEGATNLANNGLWRISHYLTAQTCVLTKSFVWWVADATSYAFFTADANADFVAESGLTWSLTDREPVNGADMHQVLRQQMIDSGWMLWQHRGPVAANSILVDEVFRSTGETDLTNLPDGRITYLRVVTYLHSRSAQGVGTQYNIYFAPFHAWDVTATATSPGNGIGGMKLYTAESTVASTPTPNTGNANCALLCDSAGCDLLTTGRSNMPFTQYRRDLVVFSDADEILIYWNDSGVTSAWRFIAVSCHNNTGGQVGSNIFSCALAATSTTTVLNTGTVDLSTKGYQVGDNITVRGMSVGTPEYIETTTISAFGGSSPNFTVTVSALSRTYGNGSDGGIKGYVGEDPFPVSTLYATNVSGLPRIHNASKLANATGRDYDATNQGTTAAYNFPTSTLTDLAPNRRTGKFCLLSFFISITGSEHRGKWKYMWMMGASRLTQGKKFLDSSTGNVYVAIAPYLSAGFMTAFGPLSKQQAGVKD
jgi:hypothetical protein